MLLFNNPATKMVALEYTEKVKTGMGRSKY